MARKKNKATLKQQELNPNKEIIILFENHHDNNAPQVSNFLLNTLSSGRITDLVLEETEEQTPDTLIQRYQQYQQYWPLAASVEQQQRLEYFTQNLYVLKNAVDKGIKVHSADVKIKLYNKLQSDHEEIKYISHRHFNNFIEERYYDFLEESEQSDTDQLLESYIKDTLRLKIMYIKDKENIKIYQKSFEDPYMIERDNNFAKKIDEIARNSEGGIIVQLGAWHVGVQKILKETGYTNIKSFLLNPRFENELADVLLQYDFNSLLEIFPELAHVKVIDSSDAEAVNSNILVGIDHYFEPVEESISLDYSQEMYNLGRTLDQEGFRMINVDSDGNCFFHAMSRLLPRFSHLELRAIAIDYINNNYQLFANFLGNNDLNEYISDLVKPGAWADNLIIQAIANIFYININIHSANGNTILTPSEGESDINGHLGYTGNHYVAAIPLENSPEAALLGEFGSDSSLGSGQLHK